MINSFKDILEAAKKDGVKKLVVPNPTAADLSLLTDASVAGLIFPCFAGDEKKLRELIGGSPLAAGKFELIEENDPQKVLGRALTAVRSSAGDILMQGGASPRELLDAVCDKELGLLPKGGIISSVSVFPLLKREKLILVTDTFINNFPSLIEKQQILINALNLARILGVETPKTAALAAIEQVNPGIPSTLDAAILSKMAERGQFGKAIVEGPLDIDCALSQVAAKRKGLQSVVTGNVDIYLVPEIDTGHLLAEALVFFGRMQTTGVVMGTTKPVIFNLPFVSAENRMVEIALACLLGRRGECNG
ncbi:MAG: phosphate acetyltransferase [Syntrophus sp. SKADARSKE-3]|nr:phosphate acetyltransferase [Syntrophus sp. SKADARSKE-3]